MLGFGLVTVNTGPATCWPKTVTVTGPETAPKGIDFILVSTKGVARGIYELDGDTLRIRKHGWGGARPTSFDDTVSFNHPVEIFTRYKRRVPIKRRVKAQIPKTVVPGGLIPKGLLNDITKRRPGDHPSDGFTEERASAGLTARRLTIGSA